MSLLMIATDTPYHLHVGSHRAQRKPKLWFVAPVWWTRQLSRFVDDCIMPTRLRIVHDERGECEAKVCKSKLYESKKLHDYHSISRSVYSSIGWTAEIRYELDIPHHNDLIVVLENVKNMRLPRSSHIRFANSQRKDNKVFIHVELPWETSCLSLTDCFFSISRHVSDCDHFKYVFVLTTWERSSAFEHIAYTDCDTQTPPL